MDEARTATAQPVTEHTIGEFGTVVILTASEDVVIRGVDGATARIVAPTGEALAELGTEAGPNRLEVRAGPGARGTTFGLGRLLIFDIGGRRSGRLELEVPRAARIEVTTASGRVRADGLAGQLAVTTASGEVDLRDVVGTIRAKTAAGRISIWADRSAPPIRANVGSISGRVSVTAGRADELVVKTMSGTVDLAMELGTRVEHAVETLSGRVQLVLRGGTTVRARTISGRVRCDPALRVREAGPGTTVVVGDGAARLSVRTASGSIEVSGPPPPDAAETPTTPPASWAERSATPEASPEAGGPDPRLAVLEALERGELDVDEALRRLDRPPGEPTAAAGGTDPGAADGEPDRAADRPAMATQGTTGG